MRAGFPAVGRRAPGASRIHPSHIKSITFRWWESFCCCSRSELERHQRRDLIAPPTKAVRICGVTASSTQDQSMVPGQVPTPSSTVKRTFWWGDRRVERLAYCENLITSRCEPFHPLISSSAREARAGSLFDRKEINTSPLASSFHSREKTWRFSRRNSRSDFRIGITNRLASRGRGGVVICPRAPS